MLRVIIEKIVSRKLLLTLIGLGATYIGLDIPPEMADKFVDIILWAIAAFAAVDVAEKVGDGVGKLAEALKKG